MSSVDNEIYAMYVLYIKIYNYNFAKFKSGQCRIYINEIVSFCCIYVENSLDYIYNISLLFSKICIKKENLFVTSMNFKNNFKNTSKIRFSKFKTWIFMHKFYRQDWQSHYIYSTVARLYFFRIFNFIIIAENQIYFLYLTKIHIYINIHIIYRLTKKREMEERK